MGTGAITHHLDVAQVVLYLFWIFLAGLLFYLIRENHREGYPMDTDDGLPADGWPRPPAPKTYLLPGGREVTVPRENDIQPVANAEKTYRGAASPIEPVGDALTAGVGPGSWSALRPDHVDVDFEGAARIVPLATLPGYGVSDRDPDPRGMTVRDVHGDVAGTVVELWLDRADMLFRYLELEVPAGEGQTRRVLLPVPFARITRDGVKVHALLAEQFAGIPATRAPDRVTLLEEERIGAYYGAGTLYAEPSRAEPLL